MNTWHPSLNASHADFRVVIVGGGFAGLRVARSLTRNGPRRAADGRAVRVLLIDQHDFFTYTPLLYSVASDATDAANAATQFQTLLWDAAPTFVQAHVTGIDVEKRAIRTDTGAIAYDRLILAPGSIASLPPDSSSVQRGLEIHTTPFMTLADAITIRERVRQHCLRLVGTAPSIGDLTVVVVGGGPKGVELIFDLADFLEHRLFPEYGLARERLRLTLVSKETRLMHEFSRGFDEAARAAMTARGIRLITGRYVVGATADRILLEGERSVQTKIVIWAAGIAPHPLLRDLDVPLIDGAIPVMPSLQVPTRPEIYVAGDGARTADGSGNRIPATASLAQQHGRFLTHALIADITGTPMPSFQHVDRGNVVRFGTRNGFAELGKGFTTLRFRGPAASAFRSFFDVVEVPGFAQKRGTLDSVLHVRGS